MRELAYVRARSLGEALTLLNEPGHRSRVLAGGTDLVRQIRGRTVDIDRLVDVSRIPELQVVEADGGGAIRIGAGVTFAQAQRDRILAERVPLLVEACRAVGGVQVRNRATIGGNVANGAACADVATVLVCLDAVAVIAGLGRERRVPVADLLTDTRPNSPHSELIRGFEFLAPPDPRRTVYLRLGRRQAMSIARASIAALGQVDERGCTTTIRLAAGAVFGHPRRLAEIETLLMGGTPSEAAYVEAGRRAAELVLAECGERWSAPYKQEVVGALVERALQAVLGASR